MQSILKIWSKQLYKIYKIYKSILPIGKKIIPIILVWVLAFILTSKATAAEIVIKFTNNAIIIKQIPKHDVFKGFFRWNVEKCSENLM